MKPTGPILFHLLFLLQAVLLNGQAGQDSYVKQHYSRAEYRIEMRDGVKLYTIVYTPKDQSRKYPILLNRTCYNASGFGDYRVYGSPSDFLVRDGYILVYQDVRGRYMSEGTFDNMRPNIPGNDPSDPTAIDESSDTWDSVEWLIRHTECHNGRVGIYGISYPGFYSSAALPDAHPAIRAVSPQAPIADFFFDDFHHHGAFIQAYVPAFPIFGIQKDSLTSRAWYYDDIRRFYLQHVADAYDYYLDLGPLSSITEKFHRNNFFWNQIIEHPNYDEFWQARSILPHLRGITPAVMTVGGWFDAEDLYGPLNTYKTLERNNPGIHNMIVMGPWSHGAWAFEPGRQTVNHIYYGDSISTFYQEQIEREFFRFHLKQEGSLELPEAYMFDTGSKKWKRYDSWPPGQAETVTFHFGEGQGLLMDEPVDNDLTFRYLSDPKKPVPYRSVTEGFIITPGRFMTDDQRHASRRTDVLTFRTPVLEESVTLEGEIMANLLVSMTGTDADFVVKLIDVYPQDHSDYDHNPENIKMGSYQQLVRSEVFRGRFRNSYTHPEPFEPGIPARVSFPLQDVLHTFKKGHRIMIQIHSTWFPYMDRNPQNYVENIYKADAEDFITSEITLHGASFIQAGGILQEP